MIDLLKMRWRWGRSILRTLYAVPDEEWPDGDGIVFGMVDTPELAKEVCEAHNAKLELSRG